jgi:hypothetical protein
MICSAQCKNAIRIKGTTLFPNSEVTAERQAARVLERLRAASRLRPQECSHVLTSRKATGMIGSHVLCIVRSPDEWNLFRNR